MVNRNKETNMVRASTSKITKVPVKASPAKVPAKAPTKTRHIRGGKYSQVDLKFTGPMPEWQDMHLISTEEHKSRWRRGKDFYYYHHTIKELRPFIVELFGPTWSKDQHKMFDAVKDCWVLPQLGAVCKMILDGAKWPEGSKEWAEQQIAQIMDRGAAELAVKVVDEPKKAKVVDVKEQLSEIIGDIEEIEDTLIRTGKVPAINFLNWLRQKNVSQNLIDEVIFFYAERFDEIVRAKAGKDAQLKEAYSHYKKKDWDNWYNWYNKILTDLDAFKRVKAAAKKVRQVKPPSPAKLVKKLKYQKKDESLNITSVDPTEIVDATQIWVYNTKTRKIGVYNASEMDQRLTVKGSTLMGWDPKTSIAKTLRKPKEQIGDFVRANKVQLRTFLDKIKTTSINMTGRINEQTLILRVYR